jgi:hypothetical protein
MRTRIRTLLPALVVAAFATFGLLTTGGVAVGDQTATVAGGYHTDACDWSVGGAG